MTEKKICEIIDFSFGRNAAQNKKNRDKMNIGRLGKRFEILTFVH